MQLASGCIPTSRWLVFRWRLVHHDWSESHIRQRIWTKRFTIMGAQARGIGHRGMHSPTYPFLKKLCLKMPSKTKFQNKTKFQKIKQKCQISQNSNQISILCNLKWLLIADTDFRGYRSRVWRRNEDSRNAMEWKFCYNILDWFSELNLRCIHILCSKIDTK